VSRRSSLTTAEPISALYEHGKVHHVGYLRAVSDQSPGLPEDEMCGWVPGMSKSPNRLDALVWALTDLMLQLESSGSPEFFFGPPLPKEFQLEPGWVNKIF
jgi:phage terminase large subunit-like protein